MPKCPYNTMEMAGKPIGMFHCPSCGQMIIAGMEHPDYSILDNECHHCAGTGTTDNEGPTHPCSHCCGTGIEKKDEHAVPTQ